MRTGAPAGFTPTSDGELCFAIEDDEHLFALVVKMHADATLRLDHATMDEIHVRVESIGAQQGGEIELAGTAVHALGGAEAGRGRVDNG